MTAPPPTLDQLLRAGFAQAATLAEQYQQEIVDAAPSRPVDGGTPWAGSVRADAVLALARAHYAGVGRAEWRDGASLEDWAVAYRHAHVMRGHDPLAARVHARVEEEVRRRFDIDIRAAFLRESAGAQRAAAPRRSAERPAEARGTTERTTGPRPDDRVVVPGPAVSSEEVRLAWGVAQIAALGFAQPAEEAVRHSRRSRALEIARSSAVLSGPGAA